VIDALLLSLGLLLGRADGPEAPPVPAGAWLPCCGASLPLDAGQAFGGPRYLVHGDRIDFFESEAPPPGAGPEPRWRWRGGERLPAAAPGAGPRRARVKWRDGALWMQAGTRIYQQDAATRHWFLMADPGLEFHDFDVDIQGRTLLIATADPRTRRYRALVEAVDADRRGTQVLEAYPDAGFERWFDRISPMVAATLLTGYESVQIQEYIVLFNPLARRAFIYDPIRGGLKEAALGLRARGIRDLADPGTPKEAQPGGDSLCWQVLPKGPAEAWVVFPAPGGGDPGLGPAAGPGPEAASGPGLRAIALDLTDGSAGATLDLRGLNLPLGFDPQGRLTGLTEALARFRTDPGAPNPAGRLVQAPSVQ